MKNPCLCQGLFALECGLATNKERLCGTHAGKVWRPDNTADVLLHCAMEPESHQCCRKSLTNLKSRKYLL